MRSVSVPPLPPVSFLFTTAAAFRRSSHVLVVVRIKVEVVRGFTAVIVLAQPLELSLYYTIVPLLTSRCIAKLAGEPFATFLPHHPHHLHSSSPHHARRNSFRKNLPERDKHRDLITLVEFREGFHQLRDVAEFALAGRRRQRSRPFLHIGADNGTPHSAHCVRESVLGVVLGQSVS